MNKKLIDTFVNAFKLLLSSYLIKANKKGEIKAYTS